MQGKIMTQVIKLHAGGRKLIVCRRQERSSLYYSLSSHNRLLYYPRVHFHLEYQLQPLSQGRTPAESMFCPQQEFLYFCIWSFVSYQLLLIWDNLMFDTLPAMNFCPTHLHRKHVSYDLFILVENVAEFNVLYSRNHMLRNYKMPLVKQKY